MTEAEWLACTDPQQMLDYLEDKTSARKFRLYHCALLRQIWSSLETFDHQFLEETERNFDTPDGSLRPAAKRRANKHSREEGRGHHVEKMSYFVLRPSPECVSMLLCVFGNPFRPVTISPAVLVWNDGLVVRLAQAAYEERQLPAGTLDNGRLAILADALEEAGYRDADIVGHCRSEGEHVRGCWMIDLLLGKS